ncbi:MAG: hypothetical protein K2L98_03890, partial [Bacilli bacterium]|nr:hypothetical protein [Bacilli bacterium]
MPNRIFSYTYALADKYVFTTKEKAPSFTVGTPTLVTATKSDGTKYDKMYINKLGEIRVPITKIENVTDKNDFNVTVTQNGKDVTSNFVISKTSITNKTMTITLAMKSGGNYVASSYVVNVSVNHEWEESITSGTKTASRVKIIRDASIGNLEWGASTNNWNAASLQALLNGRYYNATGAYDGIGLTEDSQNLISNVVWKLGGHGQNSVTASSMYTKERGTTVYSGNPTTWTGYVGLMYPSDYGFAVGGSVRSTCLSANLNSYNSNSCYTNDWLQSNTNTWFLTTRTSDNGTAFYLNAAGQVNDGGGVPTQWAVRPVVYLDTDVVVTGGTGTRSNPYTIKKSAITTNNLVQKIKTLANTDTTNLATDGTSDNNVRYIGSNPSNYISFNGEIWRIIGVMNNIEGNDGTNLEAKNNTISHTTNFALVDKYYNFEGNIALKTNYTGNPSNKPNRWEVTLNEYEEIDASKFTYSLVHESGLDYTNRNNFNITSSTNSNGNKVYSISNMKNYGSRPKKGRYTFTVSYSNPSNSNSRGTLTKTFTFNLGGRSVAFNEEMPVESHRYVRTQSTIPVSLQVTKVNNTSITFREGTNTNTMSIDDFNKIYSEAPIQNIRHTEDGDVAYSFTSASKTYFIYRITNTTVYYIDFESEEKDADGNIIDHFSASKEDFETKFPNQLSEFEKSLYSADSSGDIYYLANANKAAEILTTETSNKIINAAGGGVFYFKYIYSGLEVEELNHATYKIFRTTGEEVSSKDGFAVKDIKVTPSDEENGKLTFTLDYNNTVESYVGEYYVRFYMNDGEETVTKDIGFSLYEGDIGYYVNHSVDSPYKYSNQQIFHYIGFYLKKGSVQATNINYRNINVEIYDSFADLDSNGNVIYYDLVEYELQLVSKNNDNITYKVFENDSEVGTFTTSISDFKKSKYSQAAELLDNYKFDSTTGNLITDSTNFKENATTYIDILESY